MLLLLLLLLLLLRMEYTHKSINQPHPSQSTTTGDESSQVH